MRALGFIAIAIFLQFIPGDGVDCGERIEGTGFTSLTIIEELNQSDVKLLPERPAGTGTSAGGLVFRRWLFPSLVFSCSGVLGGWIFKAEPIDLSSVDNLPVLEVFRMILTDMDDFVYTRVPDMPEVPAIRSVSEDGVYQYTLQLPMNVQARDVVGVQYQDHPGTNMFLQLAFLNNTARSRSYRSQTAGGLIRIPRDGTAPNGFDIDTNYIPVITAIMYTPTSAVVFPSSSFIAEVSQTPTSELESSMLSDLPSPSPAVPTRSAISPSLSPSAPILSVSQTPSPLVPVQGTSPGVPPTQSLAIVVGVGVAAGFLVAIILAAIVVLVMLLVCKRKKNTQVSVIAVNEFAEPLDNPTYHPGLEKDMPKKTVESNLDAAPRWNGHLQNGFTSLDVSNEVPTKLERNGNPTVQNYEVVPGIVQSSELTSSVVYQEVQLKVKGTATRHEYYNVPTTSDTPQDYSLPTECRRPQEYAVPDDRRKPQDYAVPENSSHSRPWEYATPQNPLDPHSYSTTESSMRPQDYSFPSDSRQPQEYSSPSDLTDPQDYSIPEPEDYSMPVASERSTLKSEPYEVPAVRRPYNQRGSGSADIPDDGGSSSLDVGLCVPTERERDMYGLRPAPGSNSSTPSPNRVDEAVYSRIAELQQQKYGSQNDPFFVEDDIYWVPASSKRALYDQLARKKYREILRTDIRIIRYLGSGQFGTVNLGCLKRSDESLEVAVKMLKPHSTEEGKIKFLQEAAIMGQFLHPHVVKLHGVVTMGEPIMIVLECMEKGDLRNYLLANGSQQHVSDPGLPHMLLNFCREVASGMAYLSSKSFVHRDLAARNILLSAQETCKIGDFGMSRDLEDNNYYITHGGQIPVRWTAPEALNFRKYSTASDVWSYGTVMYEVWSLGRTPYDDCNNSQIPELLSKGFRLPPPPGCSRALYELIIRCWHEESARRPVFSAIVTMLNHDNAQLLHWSEEDLSQSSLEARALGAPKDCADKLYKDLQNSYKVSYRSGHT